MYTLEVIKLIFSLFFKFKCMKSGIKAWISNLFIIVLSHYVDNNSKSFLSLSRRMQLPLGIVDWKL